MLLNACPFLFSCTGINLAVFIDVDDEDLNKDPGEFFSLFPSGWRAVLVFFWPFFTHYGHDNVSWLEEAYVKVMASVIISISQHCSVGQWKLWPLLALSLQSLRPEWKQLAPWRRSVGSVERPMNMSTSPPVCQLSNQHWHSPSLSLHLPLSLLVLSWLTFDRITDLLRKWQPSRPTALRNNGLHNLTT